MRVDRQEGALPAAVATGHALLIAVWPILDRREPFNDLGADYYRTDTAVEARRLLRRLKSLGVDVTVNAA